MFPLTMATLVCTDLSLVNLVQTAVVDWLQDLQFIGPEFLSEGENVDVVE